VRVHSRYQRRVADAPIAGASVVIGVRGRAVLLRLFGLPEADLRRAGPWLDRAVCPSQPWSRADARGGRVDRVASEGLLPSQFWPDAPPGKHTFPMRNSVMSGYGRATIVVEAGEHSAARIQARRAVAHGAPGDFDRSGCEGEQLGAGPSRPAGRACCRQRRDGDEPGREDHGGSRPGRPAVRPSNSRVGMIPKETRQQVKDSLHREVGGFFTNTSRARHLSCMPSTICRPGEQSPQRC
jgi:hypothetical protein